VSHYYYFAATLPSLMPSSEAPMSSAEFLERARDHLDPEDMRALEAATLLSPPDGADPATACSSLLAAYYAWERELRDELVLLRARRLGRASEPWLRPTGGRGADDSARAAAQAAFAAESPLEGELVLERERWSRIDALRTLHSFDLESLAAYRLQLQVLERLDALRAERGETGYRETYAAILGAADHQEQSGVLP
jgi:hypothetical protein